MKCFRIVAPLLYPKTRSGKIVFPVEAFTVGDAMDAIRISMAAGIFLAHEQDGEVIACTRVIRPSTLAETVGTDLTLEVPTVKKSMWQKLIEKWKSFVEGWDILTGNKTLAW